MSITKPNLPADLPEDFQWDQVIVPNGADIGQPEQVGYNYLMRQVNNTQSAIKMLANEVDLDLENKVNQSLLPNPNILHNSFFKNPINQRGKISYSNQGYTIDRWRTYGEGIVTVNEGIDLLSNDLTGMGFAFSQHLDNYEQLDGETLTLSAEIDGVIYSGTGVLDISMDYTPISVPIGSTTYLLHLRMMAGNVCTARLITFDMGKRLTLTRIKLEKGNVSTLSADPPPDYGADLAACQRYCIVFSGDVLIRAASITPNMVYGYIPLPTVLNRNPSVVGTVAVNTIGGSDASGFSFSYSHNSAGHLRIVGTKAGHGMSDAMIRVSSGVILDANL